LSFISDTHPLRLTFNKQQEKEAPNTQTTKTKTKQIKPEVNEKKKLSTQSQETRANHAARNDTTAAARSAPNAPERAPHPPSHVHHSLRHTRHPASLPLRQLLPAVHAVVRHAVRAARLRRTLTPSQRPHARPAHVPTATTPPPTTTTTAAAAAASGTKDPNGRSAQFTHDSQLQQ